MTQPPLPSSVVRHPLKDKDGVGEMLAELSLRVRRLELRPNTGTLTTPADLTCTTLQISNGSLILLAQIYRPTLTPTSVAANSTSDQTFTIAGLATNDVVEVNGPPLAPGLGIVQRFVSAVNTLQLRFINTTAGVLTPASGVYNVMAIRA